MTKLTVCHQILFRQRLLASRIFKPLHINIEVHFWIAWNMYNLFLNTITWPSTSLYFYKGISWPCLHRFCCYVCLAKWSQMKWDGGKSLCRMLLITKIDSLICHTDKDTLFASCLLHKLPFIRLRAYIICFTLVHKCLTEFLHTSPTLNQLIPNNTAYGTPSLFICMYSCRQYYWLYSKREHSWGSFIVYVTV